MSERTAVQNPIIRYAQALGWQYVSRAEADRLRSFQPEAKSSSLFFDALLFEKVKEFNPKYDGTKEEILRKLSILNNNIQGNRDFLTYLRGEKQFFCRAENRELNLTLIDYDQPERNVYQVTDEFYYHNGRFGNREDIVFLINGIPIVVVECKNATKDEAIALSVDQIRRYHDQTPEMMVPEQLFTVTESIGFSYGVTWNMVRRNIFNWKSESKGDLEGKIKSFFDKGRILALVKNYILFSEKDEELNKYILAQHQTSAIESCIERVRDPKRQRGLIWHTQGSGKTFTMIKIAELLFKSPESEKPTILMLIDRNELEDQLTRNLESVGIRSVERAEKIAELNELLRQDFRGIIVSTIHKFRDMQPNINTRENIYVLVDEAHRTTQGELGNYLMAAIPKATFLGFTGTPIDKTAYGKGTFKTFGVEDKKGYLHKYSIAESINDGTTLPLFYAVAPNELLVPKQILEKEFLELAEAEGISDIDELNKVLERAVRLKEFLKGKKRMEEIAKFVAHHYKENVEPMGYKAFLVGVDREACALYKTLLDKHLPPEYSTVVFTGSHNDPPLLQKYHLGEQEEKNVRKTFAKLGTLPKILIVTEKLLTGYDAQILYAMYFDKPMRDHTLLQTIARVNRPYENEEKGMKKRHGLIVDFIGIFDRLEKALKFDSDEVKAVVKDIHLLKDLFKKMMEQTTPKYLKLVSFPLTDKDTDKLIEHFKDKATRKEFFKFYLELEGLYEIVSPDAFLRPYLEDYKKISSVYLIVRNAFAKRVYIDRDFLRKTKELIREHVQVDGLPSQFERVELNEEAIKKIKEGQKADTIKIINLIKSIQKHAEEKSDDLFLISLAQKAEQIQEEYEGRQSTTQATLERLIKLMEAETKRQKDQNEKGFDGLTYFIFGALRERDVPSPELTAKRMKECFDGFPHWLTSEQEERDLKKELYFVLASQIEDVDKQVEFVDYLFNLLKQAASIA